MRYDVTLLGFSPLNTPMLIEIAADAWELHPSDMSVQIILNRPVEDRSYPENWSPPHWRLLDDWTPSASDGRIMPGVGTEPTVSTVWNEVHAHTGIPLSALSVVAHPTAYVARTATVGPGTWIHQHAIVASFASVGALCIINRNASVGHHNEMGNCSRLNPGASTGGCCKIEERVTIGIGATVRDRVTIGAGTLVGAGAVVVRDLEPGLVVVGNPAKPMPPTS